MKRRTELMESFENAHNKTKKSSHEENIKKNLKQMLVGYNKSDNELIKRSDVQTNDFDDSTSVSGFSDLNLTNSTVNTSRETIDKSESNSISDVSEFSLSDIEFSSTTLEKSLVDKYTNGLSSDESSSNSIDECDSKLSVILEDNSGNQEDDNALNSFTSLDDSNSISFSDETYGTDEEDIVFDPKGELASKIHQKLNQASNRQSKHKNTSISTASSETTLYTEFANSCMVDLAHTNILDDGIKFKNVLEKESTNKSVDIDLSKKLGLQTLNSPLAFAKISNINNTELSLNKIIGDYRYSTIKNIPSESKSLKYSLANSSIKGYMDKEFKNIETNNLKSNINESLTIDMMDSEMYSSSDSLESAYLNSLKVFYGSQGCIFLMKHPLDLYLHGKIKISCLYGNVTVMGYKLNSKPSFVYAPSYNFAQHIQTRTSERQSLSFDGLLNKLTSKGLNVSDAEEIVTSVSKHDAVVYVQSLKCPKMDFVESCVKSVDFFSKPSKHIDPCLRKASQNIGCSFHLSRPKKCFELYPIWESLTNLETKGKGIVCGGKGSGKSTFLRYYVNRQLTNGPVLVIDLDPGQCEFTVAGNISATVVNEPLLGPNYTHLKTPEMMLNIGMINIYDNPLRYADAIHSIITYCKSNSNLKQMPWIVNTMGMCNTMGLKFMMLIIKLIEPTFVMQLDSKNPKKSFQCQLDQNNITNLYEKYKRDKLLSNLLQNNLKYEFYISGVIENMEISNSSLVPRNERYLNYLSYFSELLKIHKTIHLLGIVPYKVPLKKFQIATNLKLEDDILRVINGKIIALCKHSEDNTCKLFTLRDKALVCYGNGLIRGIDYETEILYIITPVNPDKLPLVNTLLYSDWAPELPGQEKYLPEGIHVPYRSASSGLQKQFMYAPRRRFNPVNFLKMAKKS